VAFGKNKFVISIITAVILTSLLSVHRFTFELINNIFKVRSVKNFDR